MQRAASAAKPSLPNTMLFGMLQVEMQLKAKDGEILLIRCISEAPVDFVSAT